MKTLQVRGFNIKVFQKKVKIFDPLGVVTDDYALVLMAPATLGYLAFINLVKFSFLLDF